MSDIPTDPETIKQHIEVRREAMRVCLKEIGLLSGRLREAIGPTEWMQYMAKSAHNEEGEKND